MTVIDISCELCSALCYPGARPTELIADERMADGGSCNCSSLRMSAHAGTHCDAPLHFTRSGADTAEAGLEPFIGLCAVIGAPEHAFLGADFFRARTPAGVRRLLIRGGTDTFLSDSGADWAARSGLLALGTEALSIGALGHEKLHVPILSAGICVIEQLALRGVPDGAYFLCAAPLKIAGCEAAPCRAVLLQPEPEEQR